MADTSLIMRLFADDNVGDGLASVKKKFDAAATGIAASVGAALGYGVANAMDVGAANAKLAAQLGLSGDQAARVGKISGEIYADNWGDSTETVNAAIRGVYTNIGEGNAAWVKDTAEKATAVADIFDQDVGGVTAAVGQLMRTGLVANANEAFDVITAGFQGPANKADDFLDTLNEYSGQWSKFGLDAKTATGLLSQGMQAGAKDSDLVADAIKEFSIRAIDGSASTAAGFKALGLDASDMAAKIAQGGPTASAALDLTLDKLRAIQDPVARSAAAVNLFGTQAEDLGAALYALDPSSAVSALGQVGGAADRAMTTMSEAPAARLETAKRQIQQKLTEIGGAIVGWGTQHTAAVKPLAIALGAVAAVILAVKTATMLLTVAEQAKLVATKIGTAAQWAWNAAMAANPITLIIIGIVALVAALVILWMKCDGFREAMIATWRAVAGAAVWFWDGVKMVWDKVAGFFTGLPGMIGGWFSSAGQWLYDAGSKIIEGLWTGIQFYFKIVEFFYVGLPLKILGWFAGAAMWLLGAGRDILGGLWSGIKWVWDTLIVGFYVRLPLAVLGYFASAGSWLLQKGRDILSGLWSGIKEIWSRDVAFFTGLGGTIIRAIGNGGTWLYQLGRDVITGMANGVTSMAEWLKSKVVSVVKAPIDAAKSILHIGSPSRLWAAEVGLPIAQGVAVGVTGGIPLVDRAVGALGAAAMPTPVVPAAPLAVRAVGGDGAAAPVSISFTFTGPIYADRAGVERFVEQALPAIQRGLRSYSRSNGGVTNITV